MEEEKDDVDDESNRSISQEASFEEEVKHSAPEIVKDTSNETILIKNLPDIMYTSKLKALFKDETSIVGHTVSFYEDVYNKSVLDREGHCGSHFFKQRGS